jgi:hypothetical protein
MDTSDNVTPFIPRPFKQSPAFHAALNAVGKPPALPAFVGMPRDYYLNNAAATMELALMQLSHIAMGLSMIGENTLGGQVFDVCVVGDKIARAVQKASGCAMPPDPSKGAA